MDISYEERISCAKPHTRLGHITQAEMDKNLRSRIDVKLKILYTGSRLLFPTHQKILVPNNLL
jgi:hypothetical protein